VPCRARGPGWKVTAPPLARLGSVGSKSDCTRTETCKNDRGAPRNKPFGAVIGVIVICGVLVWATAPTHIATGTSKSAERDIAFRMFKPFILPIQG